MARVIIESDDGRDRIEIRQDDETGKAVGWCDLCREWITDRGRFEDTCEAVANHIDQHEGN